MKFHVTYAGREHVVEIRSAPSGLEVKVNGVVHPVDVAEVTGTGLYSLIVDQQSVAYAARFEDGRALLSFHDRDVEVEVEDERTRLARQATGGARKARAGADVRSVMPGVVKEVRVEAGVEVTEGQALLILEAMKMENEIRAPDGGVVEAVHVAPGQAVEKGARLVSLRPAASVE